MITKLEAMRYAGLVNRKAIEHGFDLAKPGVTLAEVDRGIEEFIREAECTPAFKGYQPPGAPSPYPATACISPNSVAVHGLPGDYVLKSGDLLTIDVGTERNGYYVDAARSRVIDWMNAEIFPADAIRLVDATDHIMDAQLERVRDGCSFLELTEVSESVAAEYSVIIMAQWGGHAIGEQIHMDPFIPASVDRTKSKLLQQMETARFSQQKLSEGQTICLEPVVTLGNSDITVDGDGWTVRQSNGDLVAHTERCLLVTKNGYEIIT